MVKEILISKFELISVIFIFLLNSSYELVRAEFTRDGYNRNSGSLLMFLLFMNLSFSCRFGILRPEIIP